MKDSKQARVITKIGANLVTVGSIDFLIGGILAAVMPGGIGLPMAAARFIGSVMLAGYVGDKMGEYIDTNVDNAFDIIDQSKDLIEKVKAQANNMEKDNIITLE